MERPMPLVAPMMSTRSSSLGIVRTRRGRKYRRRRENKMGTIARMARPFVLIPVAMVVVGYLRSGGIRNADYLGQVTIYSDYVI